MNIEIGAPIYFCYRAPGRRFLPLLCQVHPPGCRGVESGGPRLLGLSLAGLHTCGQGVHPVSFVGTGLTGLHTGLTGGYVVHPCTPV